MPVTQRYDMSRPLKVHEGYMGNEYAHSDAYLKRLTEGAGAIHDPRGLLQRVPTPLETAPTQLSNANQALGSTAVGRISGKRMSSPGNPLGHTAVRAGLAPKQPVLETTAGGLGARGAGGGTVVAKKRRAAMPAVQVMTA
jgi:hypothetical protein